MPRAARKNLLQALARLYDVQTSYWDASGELKKSPPEAVLRVLRILGAPVESLDDVPNALRECRQARWQAGIDPVLVAWDGGPLTVKLRAPAQPATTAPTYHLSLESGERIEGRCCYDNGVKPVEREVEGVRYAARRVIVAQKLPFGYHRLRLSIGGRSLKSHLFSCPLRAYTGGEQEGRSWGIFAPLYALTSEKSWGAGDLSDFEALLGWVNELNGDIVGTLPLLAGFLDEPFNPSPYSPVTRLFWNELYLDVTRIPDLDRCPVARAVIESAGFRAELERVRAAPLIDYRRVMAPKRMVLEELARCFFKQGSERRTTFRRFVESRPGVKDYAAFRAKTERERRPWIRWPEIARSGALTATDYDETAKQYHLYVQWQVHEQMRALVDKTKAGGPALYLDFPLGVNPDGYDVWRERSVLALSASGGAPPDLFFTKGQNWGFPPLHPEGLRRQGYRYFIDSLRHHLGCSEMLRIDHVIGLHRLYWVPEGFAPSEGVFVRYPAKEFYAILNLESHKHRARIVGENLGTVPPYVNTALAKHKIYGMYVGQLDVGTNRLNPPEEIRSGTVAILNTHDTPTFAGFWTASDVEDRLRLGLLSAPEQAVERENRARQRETLVDYFRSRGWLNGQTPDAATVFKTWLCHLSTGAAELVLINLEDLWLEPLPQNVPGTWQERPNWQRRARFRLEEMRQMKLVVETLRSVNKYRKKRGSGHNECTTFTRLAHR